MLKYYILHTYSQSGVGICAKTRRLIKYELCICLSILGCQFLNQLLKWDQFFPVNQVELLKKTRNSKIKHTDKVAQGITLKDFVVPEQKR